MEENGGKNIKLEEQIKGKLGKTAWRNKGNRGNRWENEEIAGRKLWKNRGNVGKGLKKI
jgi:hypothetical protein